jgi:hypothetical protein
MRLPRSLLLVLAVALLPVVSRAQSVTLSPSSGVPGQTVATTGTGLQGVPSGPFTVIPAGPVKVLRYAVTAGTPGAVALPSRLTLVLAISPTAPLGTYQVWTANVDGFPVALVALFDVIQGNGPITERVVGPRIDAVRPSQLQTGQRYRVELIGKNLSPTTQLDFGAGVQLLGAPFFVSATQGSVELEVTPAAPLGVREVVARDGANSNPGPGGVEIVPFQAAGAKPAERPARKKLVPRLERIEVLAPLDPDSAKCVPSAGHSCEAPHAVVGTRFSWREQVQGLARYYVWELVDCAGTVLASAQTAKPELTLTASLLAAFPPVDPGEADRTTACGIHKLAPPAASTTGLRAITLSTPELTRALSGLGTYSAGHVAAYTPVTPVASGSASLGAVSGARRGAPATGGVPGLMLGGPAGGALNPSSADLSRAIILLPAQDDRDAWKKSQGLAAWRVKGYGPERYEDGGLTGDMVQVEESDENGLVVPLPPTGLLECAKASAGSSVSVGPATAPGGGARPGPCSTPSFICAGEDQFAALNGTIDLSRIPFDVGLPGFPGAGDSSLSATHTFISASKLKMPGGSAGSAPSSGGKPKPKEAEPQTVTLRNVFVDWGDGSEPEPLAVQLLSGQDWRKVRLADQQRHAYQRPSGSAPFNIRIYADSDPDAGHPARTATATSALRAQKLGKAGALGGGAAAVASARLGASAGTQLNHAAVSALSARQELTFLLACLEANVVGGPGQGSDDALHLVKAEITWPDPYQSASTPDMVEGSSALRPSLSIAYWGHGKVKVSWFLDGDTTPIEETELPGELPGVGRDDGENGRMPFAVQASAAVPTPLAGSPHRLTARVTSLNPPPPAATTRDGKVLRLSSAQHSYREIHTVVTAKGIVPAPVAPGEAIMPGASARHVVEGVVIAVDPALLASSGPPSSGGDPAPAPVLSVDAAARPYAVHARAPGDPHDLLYRTVVGDYKVTDVTGYAVAGNGTSSGHGMLHLFLPSGPSSLSEELIAISFSGWQVDTSTSDWIVRNGGGDPSVTTLIHPLGFDVALTKVHLSPAVVTIDGSITIGSIQGVPLPYGVKPPAWPFAIVPAPPVGDLYVEMSNVGRLPLGYSGFAMDISKVVIDFSSKRGKAPSSGGCFKGDTDERWTGVRISGTMHSPEFAIKRGQNLLPDLAFTDFSIGSGGISADLHADLNLSVPFGPMTVKADKLDFNVCNNNLDATVGLAVTGIPLMDTPVVGSIQVTADKGLLAKFEGTALKRDFTVVELNIGHAAFNYSSELGDWAVKIDSDAKLKLPSGLTVFHHQFPTINITQDGGMKLEGQSSDWFPAGDTGSGDLAGFPVQVTKLGLGLRQNGGVWFGLSGAVRISDVFEAKASDIKFLLDVKGSSVSPAGVEVGDLRLELKLPSVHATADVFFSTEGSKTRFGGEGEVALLTAGIGIKAAFLYGTDSGQTYWLAKGSLDMGAAALPLTPIPLAIYGFNGGIAHNIDLASYDKPVKDIKPKFDGSYLVTAGLQVGTYPDGGKSFYGVGTIIIQLGTAPGVRLDVDAWVLTDDHTGAPAARGCIQYANQAFDAGMTVDLSLADGAVRVKAPGGQNICTDSAISIHFGGDGWHFWLGTKARPISVGILFVNANGWLTADPTGITAGVSQTSSFNACVSVICDFCIYFHENILMEVGLQVSPFQASGHVNAGLGGGVSACGKSLGFDGTLDLLAQAPNPTQICGSASVTIHVPIFPDPKLSFGVCL